MILFHIYNNANTGRSYTFNNNSFTNNGGYHFNAQTGSNAVTVNATNNWWGTANIDRINEMIFDRLDNSGRVFVNVTGFQQNPTNAIVATSNPIPITHVLFAGQFTATLRFPEAMNPEVLPEVFYRMPAGSDWVAMGNPVWSTTQFTNDTLTVSNLSTIDFSAGNGLARLGVFGGQSISGKSDFPLADGYFQVAFPADSQAPTLTNIVRPGWVHDEETFLVQATISDAGRGDNGVVRAQLVGGYEAPHNSLVIEGTSPGGNGDGVWSFTVPPQTNHAGQIFRYTLFGWDGVGRSVTSAQQSTTVIAYNQDNDRDGLLDWWEFQQFGNLNQERHGTPNNNGIPNFAEQIMNTPANSTAGGIRGGWWNFNADTAADASGNQNNGTLRGAPTFVTDRVAGAKALRLNADGDFVEFGFSPALKAPPYTLTGFVKPTRFAQSGQRAVIWSNLGTTGGVELYINDARQLAVEFASTTGNRTLNAPTAMGLDRWAQVGLIVEPQRVALMVDGKVLAESTGFGQHTHAPTANVNVLGNRAGGPPTHQFVGLMDEFSFWSRALAPREANAGSWLTIHDFATAANWKTGYQEGTYTESDEGNFVWNQEHQALEVLLEPAVDISKVYAYDFGDRTGNDFTLRFDTTVLEPGFNTPLKFGLKRDPQTSWRNDQHVSAAFAFRNSGFRFEVTARDRNNNNRELVWPDGFRLDDPQRWMRVTLSYHATDRILRISVADRATGELLATGELTGLTGFDQNMNRLVVSDRDSSYTATGTDEPTRGLISNVSVYPWFELPRVTDLWEGDVAPRGSIDGQVTAADWTQIGRFVAGLDTPQSGGEFQRADVAPRQSAGDGKLDAADWVQVGRYAAGLDPLQPAGGPESPTGSKSSMVKSTDNLVELGTISGWPGQTVLLPLRLRSTGNVNSLSGSIDFDEERLEWVSFVPTNSELTITPNGAQIDEGKFGFLMGSQPGQALATGVIELGHAEFRIREGAATGLSSIGFADTPVARSLGSITGDTLIATFVSGGVTVLDGTPTILALTLPTATIPANDSTSLDVMMDHNGQAAAMSFTLSMNPDWAGEIQVEAGDDLPTGATIIVNVQQIGSGQVGVLLGLPAGQSFPQGAIRVVRLRITPHEELIGQNVTIDVTNHPTTTSASDVQGSPIAIETTKGLLTINSGQPSHEKSIWAIF